MRSTKPVNLINKREKEGNSQKEYRYFGYSRPQSLKDHWTQEHKSDLLRFITCGSVDDGKSTLIGRLLWDSQNLYDDQIQSLKIDSQKYGTQGNSLDLALLVDGLAAEREQGITIDIAFRYFSTPRRKFIIADTPGHEQYTRNMITGASTASLAIILVDATKGIVSQTKRHTYLVSLMGIKNIILAINKMDLIQYSELNFNEIDKDFRKFSDSFEFANLKAIPVSGLHGDNITTLSNKTLWYKGQTLIEALEMAQLDLPIYEQFIMPVQYVHRPNAHFRGFSGTIISGEISVGDQIRVSTSGEQAAVKEIITSDGSFQNKNLVATQGQSITISLEKEVDISRGDIFTLPNNPLNISDQFETTIIWLDKDFGFPGRLYEFALSSQRSTASITNIKHRIDTNNLTKINCNELHLNDIAVCNISVSKPITYDTYKRSKELGGFILIDKYSNQTVAAGLIHHNLRRADNIHTQKFSVNRKAREKINGHSGKVIWFTGLSGSGKSTLANELEIELNRQGRHTYLLDGDNVRQGLNKDLGFTDVDRIENIRRIAEVAKLMLDAGLIVITAFISPFKREREMAKNLIGEENFIEIYVNTPLEICERRDSKGLYKKARDGLLPNFSGISSPYEEPDNPNLIVNGSNMESQKLTIKKIQSFL